MLRIRRHALPCTSLASTLEWGLGTLECTCGESHPHTLTIHLYSLIKLHSHTPSHFTLTSHVAYAIQLPFTRSILTKSILTRSILTKSILTKSILIFTSPHIFTSHTNTSFSFTQSWHQFSYSHLTQIHMWQSRVEIEHYSIAQFDCVTGFEEL